MNTNHDRSDDSNIDLETLKLPTTTTKRKSLSSYLTTEIDKTHSDLPILACCLVSGLCDSGVYASWQCFVSMQTGNTVFLALGASGQPSTRPYGWLKSLTSIIFFMLGCLLFIQTRHRLSPGPLKRLTLSLSFLIQAICIFIAAALVQSRIIKSYNSYDAPTQDITTTRFDELIPLAFLAFQSGGQMAVSRLLGFGEVPTTVLTSVYCDFITDPKLLGGLGGNVKRNRRGAAIVLFLVGGICGGWLTRSEAGLAGALWISGGVKVGITIAWLFWRGVEGEIEKV